jgi:hypothetical protein
MTNQQHPIIPPHELLMKWCRSTRLLKDVFMTAVQWGADQELEAIQKEIITQSWFANPSHRLAQLRAARRPKPPSLKEQALYELDELFTAIKQLGVFNPPKIIRQALEQLDD